MDNTNITSNDLGKKGLHLSKGGKARLARNIVNVLKVDSANWQVSCCSPSSLDFLRNKHKKNVLLGYINVNSIRNKLRILFNEIRDYFDVFSIAETKLDSSFPNAQFLMPGYKTPYRLDVSNTSGGIMVYVKKGLPSLRLTSFSIPKDIQTIPIEIRLKNMKWLIISGTWCYYWL